MQKDGPIFWAARSSHPGPTLAELLARASRGAPPVELFVAVARALTDGARTCRPVADAFDVVVGVDGVINVDGLDDRRPTTWRPGYGPTLDDDVACRRLVRTVLGAHVDAGDVLARVREADADDRERERLFVAGVVRGLAPDVVEREREHADDLATLSRHAWASWSTVVDASPRGRP